MLQTTFYPNVTTLLSGLCYRNFANPSVACNVCVPYSRGLNFRQHFFVILYLWPPCKILHTSSQGNLFVGALNARGVANTVMSCSGISSPGEFLVSKRLQRASSNPSSYPQYSAVPLPLTLRLTLAVSEALTMKHQSQWRCRHDARLQPHHPILGWRVTFAPMSMDRQMAEWL